MVRGYYIEHSSTFRRVAWRLSIRFGAHEIQYPSFPLDGTGFRICPGWQPTWRRVRGFWGFQSADMVTSFPGPRALGRCKLSTCYSVHFASSENNKRSSHSPPPHLILTLWNYSTLVKWISVVCVFRSCHRDFVQYLWNSKTFVPTMVVADFRERSCGMLCTRINVLYRIEFFCEFSFRDSRSWSNVGQRFSRAFPMTFPQSCRGENQYGVYSSLPAFLPS